MNNSTISVHESLVPTSIKALKDTIPASIGFIILGLLVTISNVLQFTTIVNESKFRTRCYFLIANLSVASIINSVSYVALGLKRLIRLYLAIAEVNSKRMCVAETFTCSFGQTSIIFLPLATAVDRICAASMPIKYKNMNRNYAVLLAGLSWLLALTDSRFTFFGSDQNSLVANCNLVSATELLYQVQSGVEITISALITVCYITVIVVLRMRMKSTQSKSESLSVSKMNFK